MVSFHVLCIQIFLELWTAFYQVVTMSHHGEKEYCLAEEGQEECLYNIDNDNSICQVVNNNDNQDTTRFFLDPFEDHPCAGTDWIVLFVLCIGVHILSWIPRWVIYEPIFMSLRRNVECHYSTQNKKKLRGPSKQDHQQQQQQDQKQQQQQQQEQKNSNNATTKITPTSSSSLETTTTSTTTMTIQMKSQNFSQALTAASFHIGMAYFAWCILSQKEWLWNIESWSNNSNSTIYMDNDGDMVIVPIVTMKTGETLSDTTTISSSSSGTSSEYQQIATSINSSMSVSSSIEPDFKFYYLLYAARYISDAISLFFEHPKSDTLAYGLHHIVTVALVLLSAHSDDGLVIRMGGVIMFFFDWADPPMLLGKAVLYLSLQPDDLYQQIADICMGGFVVAFIVTRNIIFTAIVYICFRDFPNTTTTLVVLKTLLVVLAGLMTFWFVIIVKVIYYQFFHNQGHVDDIREKEQRVMIPTKPTEQQK